MGLAGVGSYAWALTLSGTCGATPLPSRSGLAWLLACMPWRSGSGLPRGARLAVGAGAVIVAFALVYHALLVFMPPTLSDDSYRYVWDGRVQAQGITPTPTRRTHPSCAPCGIRRSGPPSTARARSRSTQPAPSWPTRSCGGIWPDSMRWTQVAMSAGALAAGLLAPAPAARAWGNRRHWVLLYWWSPLLAFETAHAAHVDGLVLPLLVGAWLARARGRDLLTGVLLGAAGVAQALPGAAAAGPVAAARRRRPAGAGGGGACRSPCQESSA